MAEPDGLNPALDAILAYMRRELGSEAAMVRLVHQGTGRVLAQRGSGLAGPDLVGPDLGRGLSGFREAALARVGQSGQSLITPSVGQDPLFLSLAPGPEAAGQLGRFLACVPITRSGRTLGCLSSEGRFISEDRLSLQAGDLALMASLLAAPAELYQIENVDKALWERRAQSLSSELGEMRRRYRPSSLVGSSKAMQEVYFLIRKVAAKKTTVLLLGERGVGKETAANAIHYDGLKAAGPLVKCDCVEMSESDLFGHERGAADGSAPRQGLLEAADGGTIFLEEISELPLGAQAKLLRFLQDRSFERAGGSHPIGVDSRVVAASSRDLAALVAKGRFREDLYYRLNVFPIHIPPLRDRDDDVAALARHFLARFNQETGKSVEAVSPQALKLLKAHHWPGNVRELESVMLRAVVLAEGAAIQPHDLPLSLKAGQGLSGPGGFEARLANIEREMLVEALRLHRGNISAAAKDLGLTRRSMGLRMKRLGLSYKQFRPTQGPAA
jgi:Nif-specific regulatory protein